MISWGNDQLGDVGCKEFGNLKKTLSMTDAFRKISNSKVYTWGNGKIFSRLDRFYISNGLINFIENVEYLPSFESDHDIVQLKLGNLFSKFRKGPGYCHCNVKVLDDKNLQEDMGKLWDNLNNISEKDLDWWENSKLECKKLIIKHSTRLAKERGKIKKDLENELRKFKRLHDNNLGDFSNEIRERKYQLDEMLKFKFEGNRIRAKAKKLDNNEKPSKYFIKKEKDNANKKLIDKLQVGDKIITDFDKIKEEIKIFYADLYKFEEINTDVADKFLKDLPQLSDIDKFSCEGSISKKECLNAIKAMQNSKSPGSDGLPAEFYKRFFHLFEDSFVKVVSKIFDLEELSPSQRLSIITLICKNLEESEFLTNWRPISLLNVDYKIISKCLCNRLRTVISSIVNIDQTCGVPGRSISDNLHLIRNVLIFADEKELECALLTLDQAKAFDRVSHKFLFKTLHAFGFGPDFIKWIQILYKNIQSKVLVNGFFTSPFSVCRSVRQGCSISPLLYVLYIESFASEY